MLDTPVIPLPSTNVCALGSFAGSADVTTTSCSTLGSWLSNWIVNGVSDAVVSDVSWNPVAAAPSGAVIVSNTVSPAGASPSLGASSNAAPDASIATPT